MPKGGAVAAAGAVLGFLLACAVHLAVNRASATLDRPLVAFLGASVAAIGCSALALGLFAAVRRGPLNNIPWLQQLFGWDARPGTVKLLGSVLLLLGLGVVASPVGSQFLGDDPLGWLPSFSSGSAAKAGGEKLPDEPTSYRELDAAARELIERTYEFADATDDLQAMMQDLRYGNVTDRRATRIAEKMRELRLEHDAAERRLARLARNAFMVDVLKLVQTWHAESLRAATRLVDSVQATYASAPENIRLPGANMVMGITSVERGVVEAAIGFRSMDPETAAKTTVVTVGHWDDLDRELWRSYVATVVGTKLWRRVRAVAQEGGGTHTTGRRTLPCGYAEVYLQEPFDLNVLAEAIGELATVDQIEPGRRWVRATLRKEVAAELYRRARSLNDRTDLAIAYLEEQGHQFCFDGIRILADAAPDVPRTDKVVTLLINEIGCPNRTLPSMRLAKALGKWMQQRHVASFLEALVRHNRFNMSLGEVLDQFEIRDPRLAPMLARLLNTDDWRIAIKHLRRIGPAAEDAVYEQLWTIDRLRLDDVLELLGEIGTAKSLRFLRALEEQARQARQERYADLARRAALKIENDPVRNPRTTETGQADAAERDAEQ